MERGAEFGGRTFHLDERFASSELVRPICPCRDWSDASPTMHRNSSRNARKPPAMRPTCGGGREIVRWVKARSGRCR